MAAITVVGRGIPGLVASITLRASRRRDTAVRSAPPVGRAPHAAPAALSRRSSFRGDQPRHRCASTASLTYDLDEVIEFYPSREAAEAELAEILGDEPASTSAAYRRSSALAVPLRQLSAIDSDAGSGKISSSPFSTPSKMARATDSGEAFGASRPRDISVSTGPAMTACTLTPRPAKRARSDCDRENAAAFEIE
jgi:hypothetical protein